MGLLAPWFLGGLLALAVPVAVHLLRRHVAVPRPVSSLMFFEGGAQGARKHRLLRHRVLFALRAALLLLLVLAFAGLYVRRAADAAAGKLLMVVLDNSFSMRAGSRFADARRDALALLAARPAAQRAQVLVLGNGVQVLTEPTADARQLRSALDSVEQGDGRGSFGELGRVVRALHDSAPVAAELHLFSDMQRTAVPANFADMVLPQEVRLTIHAEGGAAAPSNWAVSVISAPSALADTGDPTRSRVQAVVAGWNTPAATRTVSLVVNGMVTATRHVDVPASGRATVEFAPLNLKYGANRCEVRLEGGDALPGDDSSLFAVQRSDPQHVLFVHADGDTRSQLYFGAALQSRSQTSFALQAVSVAATADVDPTHFAFVVLADAGSLPLSFERALRDYTRRGGSVLVALGSGAAGGNAIPLWDTPVRDVRLYTRAGGPAAAVGAVDFSHPALADAQPGRDNGGWAGSHILSAAVVDAGDARVAARLSDGTPLLLDRSVGEGHVLLFTTGFDNLSNDLPLHPMFVAFVDRTARYLAGVEGEGGTRQVGSYLQLRASTAPAEGAAPVDAIDPAGRHLLTLAQTRTARGISLDRAGFYQVRFASGRDAVIAVRADLQESDLRPMPPDMQELWAGTNDTAATAQTMSRNAAAVPRERQPSSLWWWITLLALPVAAAQVFLASGYMGTGREEA